MVTYVMLMNLTDQGINTIKDAPARIGQMVQACMKRAAGSSPSTPVFVKRKQGQLITEKRATWAILIAL